MLIMMIFTRHFNAFVRGTSSQLPFVQWLVKGAMQNVTIYESFRNTIRQKISKLTSKLLSFSKRPRRKFYGFFSCRSFSCFVHSPYQPPLILLNYLFAFALYVRFLYISRQRGKSVNLLFISSCLFLGMNLMLWLSQRWDAFGCWPLLRLKHASQNISWPPTLTHKIVSTHRWQDCCL